MKSTYRYPQPKQNISFAWSHAEDSVVSRADRFGGVTGGGIV
jgi:hypothetical protein